MENLLEAVQLSVHRAVSHLGFGFTNYRHPLRCQAWTHSLAAMKIGSGTTPLECAELHNAVRACQKIPGALAEAGVYKGATAAVMLSASAGKQIHLSIHLMVCQPPRTNSKKADGTQVFKWCEGI
jgi:hypothetical protein